MPCFDFGLFYRIAIKGNTTRNQTSIYSILSHSFFQLLKKVLQTFPYAIVEARLISFKTLLKSK